MLIAGAYRRDPLFFGSHEPNLEKNMVDQPIGKTHLGRLAMPEFEQDEFIRKCLDRLPPTRREMLIRRIKKELEKLRSA